MTPSHSDNESDMLLRRMLVAGYSVDSQGSVVARALVQTGAN
eukprot:CAMPEP_0203750744 /NCGR_PEP_ID=MMETSP0098-20131031/4932_1 /ASSEMBLY_ACC=CAM_ASM_000208 /TAXON_ID=96639 /ORGANISM=" , Strain NY0313808BC1" /LENGTH=41 /DNA_ID= /DNA_START= /DNA_END= /DNA_ORIENTATION=